MLILFYVDIEMLEDRRNYISIELFYSIVFSLKCT